MTATEWSPDQPLRADATDEQIAQRWLHRGPGNAAKHTAEVAREFAAACVRKVLEERDDFSRKAEADAEPTPRKQLWSDDPLTLQMWNDLTQLLAPISSEAVPDSVATLTNLCNRIGFTVRGGAPASGDDTT